MLSIAPKDPPGSQPADAAPATDNRKAPRRLASSVPAITGLRISPHGVEATLVNISESGVLAECGERLKPGSAVTVVFEGSFTPRTMEGRVARNSVSSMGADGRLRYHVGIAFARPIELPPEEIPAPVTEAVASAPEAVAAAPVAAATIAAAPVAAPAEAVVAAPAKAVGAAPAPAPAPVAGPQPVRNRW